jgi:hypothetical protein
VASTQPVKHPLVSQLREAVHQQFIFRPFEPDRPELSLQHDREMEAFCRQRAEIDAEEFLARPHTNLLFSLNPVPESEQNATRN